MLIDLKSEICGLPARTLRDALLRSNRWDEFGIEHIQSSFGVSAAGAKPIITKLLDEGLIELSARGRPGSYRNSTKGSAIACAKTGVKITREKATKVFEDFMSRVECLNADDHFAHKVERVTLFGSYLAEAPMVSDVDLLISLRLRFTGERQTRLMDEASSRAKANDTTSIHLWGEVESVRFLQARSRYLHTIFTHESLLAHVPQRVVFEEPAHAVSA